MNPLEPTSLSQADRELLDRLLAGEALADVLDAGEPGRAERVRQLLSLLDHWDAGDAAPGLAQRTVSRVLGADPVTLSAEDGDALDALLALRRQGLEDGPMPEGVRARTAAVREVLALLDRASGEPVPGGLAQRTAEAIERHRRDQQQRSTLTRAAGGERHGSISIRQIATTAALLLMALSVLLPMLDNAQHHAQVAQCGETLAGLGGELQQLAYDNKGATHRTPSERGTFDPLAKFARSGLDGATLPASQASLFVLIDQRRVTSEHLACPTASRDEPGALYNGQNPAAGGPFRIFLKPRPIFADANPLYRVTPQGLRRDAERPALSRSLNHASLGQNVLISDGSVRWLIRPAVTDEADASDNIWLYQPGEGADRGDDVFLTP